MLLILPPFYFRCLSCLPRCVWGLVGRPAQSGSVIGKPCRWSRRQNNGCATVAPAWFTRNNSHTARPQTGPDETRPEWRAYLISALAPQSVSTHLTFLISLVYPCLSPFVLFCLVLSCFVSCLSVCPFFGFTFSCPLFLSAFSSFLFFSCSCHSAILYSSFQYFLLISYLSYRISHITSDHPLFI